MSKTTHVPLTPLTGAVGRIARWFVFPRVPWLLGVLIIAAIACALFFLSPIVGTRFVRISIAVRVADATTGEPIKGALVVSVPDAWRSGDIDWALRAVHQSKQDPENMVISGSTNKDGWTTAHAQYVRKFHGNYWDAWSGIPVENGWKLQGLVVSAPGYANAWMNTASVTWTRKANDDGVGSGNSGRWVSGNSGHFCSRSPRVDGVKTRPPRGGAASCHSAVEGASFSCSAAPGLR